MMGETHTFDQLRMRDARAGAGVSHCGVRIAGHGVEQNGRIFCCAHCAEEERADGLRDRV